MPLNKETNQNKPNIKLPPSLNAFLLLSFYLFKIAFLFLFKTGSSLFLSFFLSFFFISAFLSFSFYPNLYNSLKTLFFLSFPNLISPVSVT